MSSMWGQLSFPVRQTLPILTTLVEGGGGEGGGGTATVASPAPLMPSGTARKLQLQKFEIADAVFFSLLLHFWLLYFAERF